MQRSERTEAFLFKPTNNWGESGHDKWLILAYSGLFVQVYLIENKEESLAKARSRIAVMGTNNIVLYQVRSSRSDFCKSFAENTSGSVGGIFFFLFFLSLFFFSLVLPSGNETVALAWHSWQDLLFLRWSECCCFFHFWLEQKFINKTKKN